MRATGLRLPILVSLALALASTRGRADEVLFLETADWVPTASVLTVPTSLLATTAVLPTSYVIPTAYSTAYVLETAYTTPVTVLEPTYYETRFRRRGLFGRRLVETSRAYYIPTTAYYPTTHYYPTVFSGPAVVDRAVLPTEYVATTATSCCGTVVADAPALVRSAPVDRPAASSAPAPAPRSRPSRIESESDDESISSDVGPARSAEPPASKPAPQRPVEPRSSEVSPPPPQAPAREKVTPARPDTSAPATKGATGNQAPASGANPAGSTAQPKTRSNVPAPTAPGGDMPEIAPAEDDLFRAPDKDAASKAPGTVRRDNLRPVLPTRTIRSEYRNVLVGIVRDRQTDDPEDEVRITVTSRSDPAVEKVAMTNAFGKFAVRVPDGDWTVKVTMPSGRVYPVSRITVSGGMVFDEDGRDVPSLIITR